MDHAFRDRLRQMRGKKTREVFAQELQMTKSNYLKIEMGRSNPTIKTLERMAILTNSTLIIDLIPNEKEQIELELENEESNEKGK